MAMDACMQSGCNATIRENRLGPLPTVLLIGTRKAGTTSLSELLVAHPRIMKPHCQGPGRDKWPARARVRSWSNGRFACPNDSNVLMFRNDSLRADAYVLCLLWSMRCVWDERLHWPCLSILERSLPCAAAELTAASPQMSMCVWDKEVRFFSRARTSGVDVCWYRRLYGCPPESGEQYAAFDGSPDYLVRNPSPPLPAHTLG
eukprot:6214747-Pleurochrysis_carterae.AAC.2